MPSGREARSVRASVDSPDTSPSLYSSQCDGSGTNDPPPSLTDGASGESIIEVESEGDGSAGVEEQENPPYWFDCMNPLGFTTESRHNEQVITSICSGTPFLFHLERVDEDDQIFGTAPEGQVRYLARTPFRRLFAVTPPADFLVDPHYQLYIDTSVSVDLTTDQEGWLESLDIQGDTTIRGQMRGWDEDPESARSDLGFETKSNGELRFPIWNREALNQSLKDCHPSNRQLEWKFTFEPRCIDRSSTKPPPSRQEMEAFTATGKGDLWFGAVPLIPHQ